MKDSGRKINIKRWLFCTIVTLLFLPIIQQKFEYFELKPLNGSYTVFKDPIFHWEDWYKGKFQKEKQDFINQNIGFRNFLVRMYNQIYFVLFRQARANGVIIGKEDYLYEENYIEAHLGRDFIGKEKIVKKVNKLKRLSDTLKHKEIDLLVVLAPGKGSFYPEYIPERYQPKRRDTTNYEIYSQEILKSGVHLLDFHRWFREMKNKSPYPLFPKTGIHWSKYGEILVADSILKCINSIKKEIEVPQLLIEEKMGISSITRFADDDIEKGMNLFTNIPDLEMAYPNFRLGDNPNKGKVEVLTIADSYFWEMHNWGLSVKAFNDGQFWYYNSEIYSRDHIVPLNVADINIKEEVEKKDMILLLCTDANLYRFAFGFIDELYGLYFGWDNDQTILKKLREKKVKAYIEKIKSQADWFELVKKDAKIKNVSLEVALRKNAEYMVWKDEQNAK